MKLNIEDVDSGIVKVIQEIVNNPQRVLAKVPLQYIPRETPSMRDKEYQQRKSWHY